MLYDLGYLCGRMQHIHIGHQHLIDMLLMTCDRALIMLGSSQESRTKRNPFTYDERKELLQMIYSKECANGRMIIKPLPDMSENPEAAENVNATWGRYVFSHVMSAMDKNPDVMIYGNDEARSKWFDKADIKDMMEIIVPRSRINISATEIRQYLVKNDEHTWRKFTPYQIHDEFNRLRKTLLEIEYYKKLEEELSTL